MATPLKENASLGINVGETPETSFMDVSGNTWEKMTNGGNLTWTENTGGPSVDAVVGNTVVWPYQGGYSYYYWPYESTDWTGKAFEVAKHLMVDKVVKVDSPKDFVKLVESIEKALRK